MFEEILKLKSKERILIVLNKVDIKKNINPLFEVKISAKTGEGIDNLFKKLKDKALGSETYSEKTAIVSNLRHFNALKKAEEHLQSACKSINEKMTGEFISVDLRNAENMLGEIIGKVTTDDILNNIFSKFCIGK